MNVNSRTEKVWIIQRCVNAFKNHYEDFEGYCENPMTYDEMMVALKKCEDNYPMEFRGHNIAADTTRQK